MDDDPSSAQRSIIDYPSGTRHMLILAGPGSGKTRVIAQRVGHLLDQQRAEPEQLVVMTFTEKAASELVARLEDRLGSVVQGVHRHDPQHMQPSARSARLRDRPEAELQDLRRTASG